MGDYMSAALMATSTMMDGMSKLELATLAELSMRTIEGNVCVEWQCGTATLWTPLEQMEIETLMNIVDAIRKEDNECANTRNVDADKHTG